MHSLLTFSHLAMVKISLLIMYIYNVKTFVANFFVIKNFTVTFIINYFAFPQPAFQFAVCSHSA